MSSDDIRIYTRLNPLRLWDAERRSAESTDSLTEAQWLRELGSKPGGCSIE